MPSAVKIRQHEMVAATMRDLSKQGVTNVAEDTFYLVMKVCFDSSNMIKYTVDALNIERTSDNG